MYNIRIKQLPKNGDQRNYSLVDRNDLYIKVNPINSDTNVKNTISAVPREEANIEAEGGETVIGDINNDGFLEHSKIVGKRHTQGGVPLNVAPGSFIFSDTKKLKIKDPEVLSIFGITKFDKGGITPAKIAQKYPMNNYMNILKDNSADPISKRTATQMLKNNLEKLGMLALVQESMKGFPDGVPAIAQSVMAGLQGQQSPGQEQGEGVAHEVMEGREAAGEEQGEMRYGGAYYQNAGTTKEKQKAKPKATTPAPGTFYINGKPNLITKKYKGFFGDEWVQFKNPITVVDEDGNPDTMEEMTVEDWNKLTKNKTLKMGYEDNFIAPNHYTDVANLTWWNQDRSLGDIGRGVKYNTLTYSTTPGAPAKPQVKKEMQPGYTFKEGNKTYKVVASDVYSPYGSESGNRQAVSVEQIDDPDQNFGSFFDTKFGKKLIPIEEYKKIVGATPSAGTSEYTPPPASTATNPYANVHQEVNLQALDTTTVQTNRSQKVVIKEDNAGTRTATQVTPKTKSTVRATAAPKVVNKTANTTSGVTTEYTDEEFEYGGTLPKHQGTEPGVPSTVQGTPEKTIVKWQISNKTGRKRPVYSDGTVGDVIEYNVADEDIRNQVGKKGYDFIDLKPEFRYQGKTVGHQTAQSGYKVDPESGFLYKDIKPGTAGLENYMEIHADAINAFPGGKEAWKKTMLANPGKENAAMTHLLNYENAAIGLLSGDKPYVDLNKPGALVPGVENFNLPGIKKKPAPVTPQVPPKEEIVVNQIQNQPIARRRRPWWIQDTMNYAAAMTDDVNYYPPAMSQVDLETPGYVLKDPDRQIAALQEQAARQQEGAYNSTAGNVAGASMVGQSDRNLGAAANIIGGVENENVNIVNPALARNAQITNQEAMLNENAKQNYIAQSATARQNYDNALRDLKWRQVKAWNQGTTNWMRHKQMEDVLFPNVGIDSITGDVYFPGGRQMYDAQGRPLYDPYINPTDPYGKRTKSGYSFEERVKYWKSQGYSNAEAIDAANSEINGKAALSNGSLKNSEFGDYMAAGKTLPQETKYGGKVKKQYGGVVFDFGALPLYFFED